eukprot:CAMPEP_0184859510 /NCGR_PEP_ID=MMETSP0580-20130426/4486_1 /TAXON_ID=1118495 /ORGANISM="Dactyliosolen fragilissimus" /LENGTH=259 /DNA_ID=CAMNT_0027356153 /DNA_START=152 /DNA_END=931 /DNA_ORIENTATION=+
MTNNNTTNSNNDTGTRTTKRVRIDGQFTIFCCTAWNTRKVEIDRQAFTNTTSSPPPNWNAFCDSIDNVLSNLTRVKRIYAIGNLITILLTCSITIYIMILEVDVKNSMSFILYGICFSCAVLFYGVLAWTIKQVYQTNLKLKEVCRSQSGNGVEYIVSSGDDGNNDDGRWERSSMTRILFIKVTTVDMDGGDPEAQQLQGHTTQLPPPQQIVQQPVLIAHPVPSALPLETNTNGNFDRIHSSSPNKPSNSLFDQLKFGV